MQVISNKKNYKNAVETLNAERIMVTTDGYFAIGICDGTSIEGLEEVFEYLINHKQEMIDNAKDNLISDFNIRNITKNNNRSKTKIQYDTIKTSYMTTKFQADVLQGVYDQLKECFKNYSRATGYEKKELEKKLQAAVEKYIQYYNEFAVKECLAIQLPNVVEDLLVVAENVGRKYQSLVNDYKFQFECLQNALDKERGKQAHEVALQRLDQFNGEVYIRLDDSISIEHLQEVLDYLSKLDKFIQPKIQFNVKDEFLSNKMYDMVKKYHFMTKRRGWNKISVGVTGLHRNDLDIKSDYEKGWTPDTVFKANDTIRDFVKSVKDADLSPLEAAAAIHLYVSSIAKYNESSKDIQFKHDASIIGAFLETPELVCAGYTAIVKAIVKELNMEGLQAEEIHTKRYQFIEDLEHLEAVKNDEDRDMEEIIFNETPFYYEVGYHSNVKFTIDDKKYQRKGDFLNDATHDNIDTSKKENVRFAHCLVPLGALYDYKYCIYQEAGENGRGRALPRKISEEKFQNGLILQDEMTVVENGDHVMLTQAEMERIIYTMFQKMYPETTKDDLYKQMVIVAKECHERQMNTWGEEMVVFKKPNTILTKNDMSILFDANKKSIRSELKNQVIAKDAYYNHEIDDDEPK